MSSPSLCGICGNTIALFSSDRDRKRTSWMNGISTIAHINCVRLVESAEKNLKCLIDEHRSSIQSDEALQAARAAVQQACKPRTILTYKQEVGDAALTNLFNTFGRNAVYK